jgi:hypothetical protein
MPTRQKRRASRARPGQSQSASGLTRVKLSPRIVSEMIAGRRVSFPTLPNEQDNGVIRKLLTAGLGDLHVDQFGRLLHQDGRSNDRRNMLLLRVALIQVYLDAAHARQYARAAENDIASARAALGSLTAAITRLGEVRPKRQRGVAGLFGSPLDDVKGLDELNEFGSRCWQIQLDLVPFAEKLDDLITTETAKSKASKAGERKKRLRFLVEELAEWWSAATGLSIAPYVQAKRLDHRPAFVVGRRGLFVEFAQALLCEIDEFTTPEVISAITNVHESFIRKRVN